MCPESRLLWPPVAPLRWAGAGRALARRVGPARLGQAVVARACVLPPVPPASRGGTGTPLGRDSLVSRARMKQRSSGSPCGPLSPVPLRQTPTGALSSLGREAGVAFGSERYRAMWLPTDRGHSFACCLPCPGCSAGDRGALPSALQGLGPLCTRFWEGFLH